MIRISFFSNTRLSRVIWWRGERNRGISVLARWVKGAREGYESVVMPETWGEIFFNALMNKSSFNRTSYT